MWSTIREFLAARKGKEGLTRRLRFVVLAVLAAAALAMVTAVSAATVRPLLAPSPFTPLAGASTPCLNGPGIPCYVPAEIQQAYNFPSGSGAPTGAGQTIVVVTAYGAPFTREDLFTFALGNGIRYRPNLTVYSQQTAIPTAHGSGQTYFWQVETDLDAQWAYAMAPQAHIVIAVANSDDTLDVAQVMREVLPQYPGAIVTQSFGMDETGPASDPALVSTFSPMYLDTLRHGGTVLAASGDLGASNGTELEAMFSGLGVTPSAMAAYPASDPLVLAVGGTMGNPYPDGLLTDAGTYGAEQAWNEISPFGQPGATGGAPSVVFDAPPWQRSLHTKARLDPDVSYNAALVDGALVILSCRPAPDGTLAACDPDNQGYVAVGGTSAGAPQWAAIVALANQVRMNQARAPLGLVSPLLYDIARDRRAYARDFNDITTGSNALDLRAFGSPVPSAFGFAAAPGYDLATGLGTPNVANLLGDLARGDSGEIPGNVAHGPKADKPDKGKHHHFDPSK
jgi:subtilase family serine protease